MSKIHLLSDLHLEHKEFTFPEVGADYLCIAGDLGGGKYLNKVKDIAHRYKKVFLVMGNHDYYSTQYNMREVENDWRELLEHTNIELLNSDGKIVEDDFVIIGTTLWTDFHGGCPVAMGQAKIFMPDYRGYVKDTFLGEEIPFSPELSIAKHKVERKYILNAIKHSKQYYPDKKIIIMTHHMPSDKLTSSEYKNNKLNGAFSSKDMDEAIAQVDYWFYGHTHTPFIGKMSSESCKFYCNPRGYPFEKTLFNPELVIEVN